MVNQVKRTSFGQLHLLEQVVSLHTCKCLLVLLEYLCLVSCQRLVRILAVTLLPQVLVALDLAELLWA